MTTTPSYFTVVADYKAFVEDAASDSDYDPQIVPVSATVTFRPLVNDVVTATNAAPRPTGFIPATITAIIDPTDGRLKLRTTADAGASGGDGFAPVRLLCSTYGTNNDLLELDGPLYYSVTFSNVLYGGGRRGTIAGFTFEAPSTPDAVLNLITVSPSPGQIASGITKIAPGAVRLAGATGIQFSFAGVDIPDVVSLAGLTGPTGPAGASGGTGGTGGTGAPGASGPQGSQGPQGIQGQAGVSLDIEGYLSGGYAALLAISNPQPGKAYVLPDGLLYYYDGTSWPAEGSGAPFQGEQGPIGPQGPIGLTGASGASGGTGGTGGTGGVGATGPQGASGAVGARIVGSVATYASLPGSPDLLDAYVNVDDGLLYIAGASGFPASGFGVPWVGPAGSSFSQLIGDGTSTSITVTHGLGTRAVAVAVYDASSWVEVEADVVATSNNAVTLSFASAPASNSLSVAVVSGGSVGATGASGASGQPGASGEPGAAGPVGATGATGLTGGTGGTGAPGASGVPGTNGVTSLNGATGDLTGFVTESGVQSLSNKTIASPALSGTATVASGGGISLFNTADQATNFERGRILFTSNTLTIDSTRAGSGTLRPIMLSTGHPFGGGEFGLRTSGVGPGAGYPGTVYAINSSSVANTSIFGTSGQLSSSSGTQYGMTVVPVFNQSGTASYTALLINPAETATGSGTKRLIDAQVGGSSRFVVDNAGTVSISGTTATIRAGSGSPEGVVTANVGSMFTRTDGGAGTTLYVKESGSGNTGWVAK